MSKTKIAIIGAGVAGTTAALHLGQLGLDITLFEKKESISSGPPYCHLHAGGNLYREISDDQCVTLLRQSIDFVKYYPFIVDYRPTVIVTPKNDASDPSDLIPRLKILQKEYERLIDVDVSNEVLGKSTSYYTLYWKEDVEILQKRDIVNRPESNDEWVITALKHIDLATIKFPIVLVQEYGMNLFRFGAGTQMAIEKIDTIDFSNNTTVEHVNHHNSKWQITYTKAAHTFEAEFDYLINASGFRTGSIDDMVEVTAQRMVEFKASYISKWREKSDTIFPEIIFHGERGTPHGMAQFTPYPGGYFQLHGMTNDITLYDDGLVSVSQESTQPRLKNHFIQKLDHGWEANDVKKRTNNAIHHLQQYIPAFKQATVGASPLFGAQQIPGDDPTLRVAEVSFPKKGYARCEIVKVSSALDMADAIAEDITKLGLIDLTTITHKAEYLKLINEKKLQTASICLAKKRGYPEELGMINVNSLMT